MDIIWNLLIESGITLQNLDALKHSYTLLMLLPFVATIVGIGRYIIGLRSLSIYAPIVLTFVFYEISYENNHANFFNGIKLGYVVFFVMFLSTMIIYSFFMKKIRMHYIPKISIVLAGVSLAEIALLIFAARFGFIGLISIDVFTLIMITSLSERLISIFAKQSLMNSATLSLQTIILATISFGIITLTSLPELVNQYPLIIILTFVINVFVGRFTGLRLTEYYRFRDILLLPDQNDSQSNKK